jgi:hypothetical protein
MAVRNTCGLSPASVISRNWTCPGPVPFSAFVPFSALSRFPRPFSASGPVPF